MPLYEYVCQECRSRHDIRHGFDETAGSCPACGGRLERIFNVGGIHFKGSGFYSTDSRKSSPASSGSSSSSSGSGDSAGSSSKVAEKSA